jgi:hypothetical protein
MGIIEGGRTAPGDGHSSGLIVTDVTIPTAGVLTLNATPVTVLAAPGANLAHIVEGVVIHKPAGTAYAAVASGDDLSLSYTDASGLEVGRCEMTGFADSTGVQTRYINAYRAASAVSSITPVANAVIAAHMLTGEITTGSSDFILRIFHRIVATVLS